MSTPIKDTLAGYRRFLAANSGLSAATIRWYADDVGKFARSLGEIGVEAIDGINGQRVREVMARWHRQGLRGRSIARALSSVRHYLDWLIDQGLISSNHARKVKAPKSEQRLPGVMGADLLARLFDHLLCDPSPDAVKLRDIAMLELCYSSGLRLAELVGLDILDIDLSEGIARVLGKGGKVRDCPVGAKAVEAIRRWLAVRHQLVSANTGNEDPARAGRQGGARANMAGGAAAARAAGPDARALAKARAPSGAPLFLGKRGGRISPRVVQSVFSRRATEAGISQHLHPHLLRHSFASHLLESSHDLRAVQELLGHANIATTEIYTHLDFQAMAKVYDETHPRARRQSKSKSSGDDD